MVSRRLTKKGIAGEAAGKAIPNTHWNNIVKRQGNNRSMYVRGHLLNGKVHGQANWNNLVPFTQEANSAHLSKVEAEVKLKVSLGQIVYYKVVASYPTKKYAAIQAIIKEAGIREGNTTDTVEKAYLKKVKVCAESEKHMPESIKCWAFAFDNDKNAKRPYPFLDKSKTEISNINENNRRFRKGRKIARGLEIKAYRSNSDAYNSISKYSFTK